MKVISTKNLPIRLPVYKYLVVYLTLEHFNAPTWLYGAMGMAGAILLFFAIKLILEQKETDIFEENTKHK